MRTKKVTVVPYDIAWEQAFEEIKTELEAAVGDLIIGIEHVGSTSVKGLAAKPCIDLDVVISDYSVFERLVRRLEDIGYIHEGDLGIKDREAFCYTEKEHLYRHLLYVCPKYSMELYRHITFREYLKSHKEDAMRYGEVKIKAAQLYPNDIDRYIEYKSSCIEEMYRKCMPNIEKKGNDHE